MGLDFDECWWRILRLSCSGHQSWLVGPRLLTAMLPVTGHLPFSLMSLTPSSPCVVCFERTPPGRLRPIVSLVDRFAVHSSRAQSRASLAQVKAGQVAVSAAHAEQRP